MLEQRFAETRDHLRESGRRVRVGAEGARGAGDELERRLDHVAAVPRSPKIAGVDDGPEHLAQIASRAVPRVDRIVDAAVGRIVGDESRTQPPAHVVHRRVTRGEQLEQPDPFVFSVSGGEHDAEHGLLPEVVGPFVEDEPAAPLRAVDAPSGENARDGDHVLLRVAAVDAEGVQLQQLTGVVLVQSLGHAVEDLAAQGIPIARIGKQQSPADPGAPDAQSHAVQRRRDGPRGDALPVVEIEQHRRAAGRSDQQVFEPAQHPGPDGRFDVRRYQKPIHAFAEEHVEMIEPEIGQHGLELALGEHRPGHR